MARAKLGGRPSDAHDVDAMSETARPSPGPAPYEIIVFSLVVLGIVLAASAATLTTYPAIHTDEPWYANLAWNWATTGNRWTTLDVGPMPAGHGASTTRLGALPTRLAIEFGGRSLAAIRLPSLIAAVLLLGVVAATGRMLWAWPTGLLAAVVLSLDPMLVLASHVARPEIWLALAVQAALACTILGWKQRQPLWDVAAAALTAVSVEIHQNGAVFAVGLAAGYLALYGLRFFRQRNALAFLAASLVGAVGYFLVLGAAVPASVTSLGAPTGTASAHTVPLVSSSPLIWIAKEVARYMDYLAGSQIGGVLLILALVTALRRRSQVDRLLLTWILGSAVGMMVLVSRRFGLYPLPIVAVGCLLSGRLLADLLQRQGPWATHTVAIALIVWMIPLVLRVIQPSVVHPEQLHKDLRGAVPCERIIGPNQYWLAFPECDYRSIDVLNHYYHRRGVALEQAMGEVRPDYLIVDKTVTEKLEQDFGPGGSMLGYYVLPRASFERFLDEHTSLERLLYQRGYGTIQIRKVHWEAGP